MKLLIFAAIIMATTSFARTGDVSYEWEVEKQLEQTKERRPTSVQTPQQEHHDYMKKRHQHYLQHKQGQKKEQ
jgi:hypothetical protein